MALSLFSGVKKIDFASEDWTEEIDPVTQERTLTYTGTGDTDVTIHMNGPPASSETIVAAPGTVIKDSGAGSVTVRTP